MYHRGETEFSERIKRNYGTICYTLTIACIMFLILIAAIVGAVNISHRYTNRRPSCVTNPNKYRLPESIKPTVYKLHIAPNLKNFTFQGYVETVLEILEPTNCIFLHQEELSILSSEILDTNQHSIAISNTSYDPETFMLHYTLDEKLQVGQTYVLRMRFTGNIRSDLRGLYKSSFSVNNETKWIATTQFEASDARTAFPCFDEPSFKAQVQLNITLRDEDNAPMMKVLSNMPEQARSPQSNGDTIVQFTISPPMSTYLICIIVGEFDYISARDDKIEYRVYAVPGQAQKGAYALSIAQEVTKFFNTFFGIDYVLPKMDLIAIPDFRAGAMENWGLITYRESRLLLGTSATNSEKMAIAEVVAHELAHQWSGNLVTMKWWSELYLNEGFATFFESFVIDKIHPEYKEWDSYLISTIQPLMSYDSLQSTHPLVYSVNKTAHIEEIFDVVTYNKGSAVLRMMYHFLGETAFQSWMQAYFAKFKFKSVVTEDLLAVLSSQSSDQQIVNKVKTWTHNPGYPVITLRHTSGNMYQFSQSRFYLNNENRTISNWWIPVTYITSSGATNSLVFNEGTSAEFAIDSDWIKANAGQVGVYRVNYTPEIWAKLGQALKVGSPVLTINDRFGLVDDVFALARTGELKIPLAFEFARALGSSEREYTIWLTLVNNLNAIGNIINKESLVPFYERFVAHVINDTLNRLGWDEQVSDTDDIKQLRALVIATAANNGNQQTISEAKRRFALENAGTMPIPIELRTAVFSIVVRYGGEAEYNAIMNEIALTSDPFEQGRLRNALTATRIPSLLKRTLEYSISPQVRSQDGAYMIRYVCRNPYGTELAWDWIRANFDAISAKFGPRVVDGVLILGSSSLFSSQFKYDEVAQFWKTRTASNYYIRVALETILGNKHFLEKNLNEMKDYLQTQFPLLPSSF